MAKKKKIHPLTLILVVIGIVLLLNNQFGLFSVTSISYGGPNPCPISNSQPLIDDGDCFSVYEGDRINPGGHSVDFAFTYTIAKVGNVLNIAHGGYPTVQGDRFDYVWVGSKKETSLDFEPICSDTCQGFMGESTSGSIPLDEGGLVDTVITKSEYLAEKDINNRYYVTIAIIAGNPKTPAYKNIAIIPSYFGMCFEDTDCSGTSTCESNVCVTQAYGSRESQISLSNSVIQLEPGESDSLGFIIDVTDFKSNSIGNIGFELLVEDDRILEDENTRSTSVDDKFLFEFTRQ